MSLIETVDHEKNDIFGGIQDDVDPPQQISHTTDTPSAEMTESDLVTIVTVENDSGADVNNLKSDNSADSIKQKFLESAKEAKEMFNKTKRKRRRRKSKRKSYNKPYAKTNWKFQVPKVAGDNKQRRINMFAFGQPIAPYNTNKFLMEDHMVEMQTNRPTTGRTRDSSFSVDSEENYFFSLPEDEEEFLTKEFSSVYEIARSERLENMSKSELIKEFLQLEADFEQLNKTERQRKRADVEAKEQQKKYSNDTQNKIYALEEKVKELVADNNELKRLMNIRGLSDDTIEMQDNQICSNSSEDSESDSSSSSSSSSSGSGSNSGLSNSSHRSSLSCDNEDYSMGFNEDIQPLCNGDALSNEKQLNCNNELNLITTPSPPHPLLNTIEQNHQTASLTKSPTSSSQPLVMN